MGKETDLWDDSALINAFDQALSKYKVNRQHRMHINMTLHDNTGEEKSTNSKNDYSTEEMQENVETDDKRNDTVEATSVTSMPCSSNRIAHDLPPINESKPEEGSFFPESNQEAPGATSTHDRTNSLEEAHHNRLLNQYYEIEEKRQKILQQLQQVGYWNDPSSSQYQTPQLHEGTNISNLGLLCPCLSCGHCGGCALNYSSCGTSCPWDACKFLLQSHQISAEMVAERSACSMKFDTPATPNVSEERKHMGNAETSVVDGGQVSQTNEMETDLSVVMSAWYSAGFYTGRNKRLQGSKETDRTTFLLAPQRPLLQFPLSSVIRGPQRDGLWANVLIPDMEGSAPMVEDEEECREIKRSTSGSSRERKRKGNAETSVVDGGQVSQTNEMETDLSVVMSAWYSAGFYSGRYLLEQSLKKGSR